MPPAGLLADADELYRLYQRAVHAYALRLTDDPDWAEDLLQETFYRAIRSAASYRGEASPLTWLCTITRHLAATQARRQARSGRPLQPERLDGLHDPTAGPDRVLLKSEQRADIARTLASLPEQQRLALLLRDLDELPYETIGEILGLSLANVKVTIHRARVRFRATYRGQRRDDDDHA